MLKYWLSSFLVYTIAFYLSLLGMPLYKQKFTTILDNIILFVTATIIYDCLP